MKKIIVIAFLFLATVCWADMPAELFRLTNTVDVTALKKDKTSTDIFGLTKDRDEFKTGLKNYFTLNGGYFMIKDWVEVDATSDCCAVTDIKSIYAICVDGQTVIIKKIIP